MNPLMIDLKNLRKSFGHKMVLDGINLSFKAGEIVFVLGTSGTGKSVLLKNIVGLLRPDSGEIWVENKETSALSEEELVEVRKTCGMVFQHPALFDSMSVFDNVAFGLRRVFHLDETEITRRVRECLKLVHLRNVDDLFPAELSYGMQKRVSLARTLALRPKILLFDEPTTGLDPVTTSAINKLILELSRELKTTSIVVSHDIHCAFEIADRVVFLDGGRVIEDKPPSLLTTSSVPLVISFLSELSAGVGP